MPSGAFGLLWDDEIAATVDITPIDKHRDIRHLALSLGHLESKLSITQGRVTLPKAEETIDGFTGDRGQGDMQSDVTWQDAIM